MRHWLAGLGFLLLIGFLTLLTACRSTPGTFSRPAGLSKQAAAEEADLERRAEAHALFSLGVVHEVNHDTDAALSAYRDAARLEPEDEDLALDVSRRFLQNKKTAEAIELLEPAAAAPGASVETLTQLGLAYGEAGQQEKAQAAYERAVASDPAFFPAQQQLFVSLVKDQRPHEAKEVLDRAAAARDLPPEFLLGIAELNIGLSLQSPELREECRASAVALLARVEALQPEDLAVRLVLADHLNALGQTQKAAELYLKLLEEAPPGDPDFRARLHAKLTELYLRTNDAAKADEQLQAIIRSDPTNPQAYYFLGLIAMERKQPEKAVEYFQKTVLLKPEVEQTYYDLANAQISANQVSAALGTLAKVRETFKPSFLLEYLTAIAHTRQEAYKDAMSHYTAAELLAQANEPKRLNQFFYFQYGAASERHGDYQQAETLLEKALALQPDFHEAQNYLGYMWADRGVNLDRARDLIEQALKAEPANDAYLDSMGWVLFRLGKPKEALAYLVKAAELTEKPDATVHDHLGDVYSALGEIEKAREAWNKSVSIEDSPTVRKKLEADSTR